MPTIFIPQARSMVGTLRFAHPTQFTAPAAEYPAAAPNAADARICSYECTFCAECVETKLHNVCPNCGGGFAPRPIRPVTERRPGECVTKQLPSDKRVHLKYSVEDVAAHCAKLRDIPPQER